LDPIRIVTGAPGEATYRAITFCELLKFHGSRLRQLLKLYPVAKRLAFKVISKALWRRVVHGQVLYCV
jgi:hypothetical protein